MGRCMRHLPTRCKVKQSHVYLASDNKKLNGPLKKLLSYEGDKKQYFFVSVLLMN